MVGILMALGACASPGPPRPPSLNLPEVPSSFVAERVGDRVELHWNTPEKTTDGLDVRGPTTAVVCRRIVASPDPVCAPILRMEVGKGLSNAVDPLPPALTAGPAEALEYRLEIVNARGRSGGATPFAFAASGSAPYGFKQLQVKASPEGAVLQWTHDGSRDTVELHRLTTPAIASASKSKMRGMTAGALNDASDMILRVPAGEGALDRSAVMGERYTYTAQRVRSVRVANHALEMRGPVSEPVALEMRDVFPPRRPTGLEAVAGDRGVDLSWEPNTEPDLAGYIVQRQEADLAQPLTTAPSLQPSFQDKTPISGHSYTYTIIAVDKAGNRSPVSEPASVSLHSNVP